MAQNLETIVFFDGHCGLCSRVVDFLIARDRARKLRYSPLQGETAKELLTPSEREDLDTMILVRRDPNKPEAPLEKLKKSDAALASFEALGGLYGVLARVGTLFPRPLRNACYELIAENRFRIFGKRETCRLPTKEERALFLP